MLEIALELESNYINVETLEKFGDVTMYRSYGKDVIHSYAYLAADMVFTKNGMGAHQPWTIALLREVFSIYGGMKIVVKRRKP